VTGRYAGLDDFLTTVENLELVGRLAASPAVLFLVEPTTGLDPAARQALWDVVAELTAAGTSVVLTTQCLEEADRLADQVVVLDHGRVAGSTAVSSTQSAVSSSSSRSRRR
jgi:ABC-2 type transport system ATP-binding protein